MLKQTRIVYPTTSMLPNLDNFDALWDSFFFTKSDEAKPPYDRIPLGENGEDGWQLQVALAGFAEEDIKIFTEGRTITIAGDNLHREDISEKFRSSFSHVFTAKDTLDLEAASITLFNGLLTVTIPMGESSKKRFLFGQ